MYTVVGVAEVVREPETRPKLPAQRWYYVSATKRPRAGTALHSTDDDVAGRRRRCSVENVPVGNSEFGEQLGFECTCKWKIVAMRLSGVLRLG
jgi:hypothetical protein